MGTLLSLNSMVAKVSEIHPQFRRFVDGVPSVLIEHGQVNWANMNKENISTDELMAALREHEVQRIEDVSLAMIEVDGGISVIRKEEDDDDTGATRFVHSHRKRRHHIRETNG